MSFLILRKPSAPPIGTLNHGDAITFSTPGTATLDVSTGSGDAAMGWDYGQDGPNVLNNMWTGGWPSAASNSIANMKNRSLPFQALGSSTMSGPTPNTLAIVAGCHHDVNVSNGGNAVSIWRTFTTRPFPFYDVVEYYWRQDPFWWYTAYPVQVIFTGIFTAGSPTFSIPGGVLPLGFTAGDTNAAFSSGGAFASSTQANPTFVTSVDAVAGTVTLNKPALLSVTQGGNSVTYVDRDENNKKHSISAGAISEPFTGNFWYTTNSVGGPKSNSAANSWATDQSFGVPQIPDQGGHGSSWGSCNNPANPLIGWIKSTLLLKWTTANTGFFRYYETDFSGNGQSRQVMNYAGPITYSGGSSVLELGGYARNQGAMGDKPGLVSPVAGAGTLHTQTQWRYFAELFSSRQLSSLARLYATNTPTFAGPGSGQMYEPQIPVGGSWNGGVFKGFYNKGNLAAGPVWFSFMDEVNGFNSPVNVGTAVSS